MATKAELEQEYFKYHEFASAAKSAMQLEQIFSALQSAIGSLSFIDGMMQYARKYENQQFESVGTIDLILRYAPVMFDSSSLDALSHQLKSQKRIVKNASGNLIEKLTQSRKEISLCHRLWSHIELNPNCRQDELRKILDGNQDWCRWVAEVWESQGFLRRLPNGNSHFLYLSTQHDEKVHGKCPKCGASANGKKHLFWQEENCPKCHQRVFFVLIESPSQIL